jgi:hypothetical protein
VNELCIFVFTSPDLRRVNVKCNTLILGIIIAFVLCVLSDGEEHNLYFQSLYLPTDAQKSCFKRILKFTLKQLLHVSVQSPPSGSVSFELTKVVLIKIIS